jgi:hypothetical protein
MLNCFENDSKRIEMTLLGLHAEISVNAFEYNHACSKKEDEIGNRRKVPADTF